MSHMTPFFRQGLLHLSLTITALLRPCYHRCHHLNHHNQYHPYIIIIIIISFMQGIYTYIPETNHVPTEYSVAAILLLLFMVLISLVSVLNILYFYSSTFRSVCVQCPIWLFSVVPSLHVFPVCCSRIF